MKFTQLFFYLLLPLVYSQCTDPFEAVGGSCYVYSGDVGVFVPSYSAALGVCGSLGGYLAMVKRGEENRAVLDTFLLPAIAGDKVLLGASANDLGLFEWLDGSLVRDGFSSWGPGEPSGDGGCVGFSDEHSLFWDDFPCDNYTSSGLFVGFLCEQLLNGNLTTTTTQDPGTTTATTGVTTTSEPSTTTVPSTTDALDCSPPFEDLGAGCFCLHETPADFAAAEAACLAQNSHLAYLTAPAEQTAIEDYLNTNGVSSGVYVGAFDLFGDDSLYWLDGTPLADGFTNLDPDNSGGDQDALYLNPFLAWLWSDIDETNSLLYLCERDVQ